MTGYALPTPATYVPSDWADHQYRDPPSSEAGTDYAAAYGSPCYAVEAGTVVNVKTTNSGGTGRFVEYRLDDGRTTRPLHLSAVYVQIGWRVARGAIIGLSGASGQGSDWYYGSHTHQTLWPGGAFQAPTLDFELYLGGGAPPPETPEDDMPLTNEEIDKIAARVWAFNKLTEATGTASAKAVLGQAWERAGKAASRSKDTLTLTQELVDALHRLEGAMSGADPTEAGHAER